MVVSFLSCFPPAGLCGVLGVSAAGCHADLSAVVGEAEGADELLEELPFGAECGEQWVRPGLACVADCCQVG
jgi:hypothetical protein